MSFHFPSSSRPYMSTVFSSLIATRPISVGGQAIFAAPKRSRIRLLAPGAIWARRFASA
jgi:hypothetical protein